MTEQWDINLIHPDPENLRRDTKADKDLVASVKALGIIEPLIVVAEDDGVGAILVAGARRLDAAKQAGLKVVPVVVREYTAEQRTMVMLVENLRRVDLDPIEEATGYVRLVGMGMTKKDLATQVGRTQAHVTARMKLLELPPKLQESVSAGDLGLEAAVDLVKETPAAALAEIAEQIEPGRQIQKYEITEAARKAKNAKAEADEREKLAAQGKRVLDEVPLADGGYSYSSRLAANHAWVGGEGIDVDPKKHQELDCAAFVVVSSWNGTKAKQLCTEQNSHNHNGKSSLKKKSGPGSEQAKEDRSEAAEAKAQAERERRERRSEVAAMLTDRKFTKADRTALIFGTLFDEVEEWNDIAHILGIEVKGESEGARNYAARQAVMSVAIDQAGELLVLSVWAALQGIKAIERGLAYHDPFRVATLLGLLNLRTELSPADGEALLRATERVGQARDTGAPLTVPDDDGWDDNVPDMDAVLDAGDNGPDEDYDGEGEDMTGAEALGEEYAANLGD
jgi:ParB family chromosome partitioning protein